MNLLLEIAQPYFTSQVAPKANIIDQDSTALKVALQGMSDRSLLALQVPKNWGGSELSSLNSRMFQIMVAKASGALAFLQTQHQSAANKVANSSNENLKQEYLPAIVKGELLVGVGFSQLRRLGKPMMKALPVKDGYLLTGEVPWITGYGFFSQFIIGATLPDGEELYGIVPLEERENIKLSTPMPLIAMTATNTVSAKFHEYLLKGDRVLFIKEAGNLQKQDLNNVLHHSFFALGCAQASIDILDKMYQKKELSCIKEVYETLQIEVNKCCQDILEIVDKDEQYFAEKLKLRAKAINLAATCSHKAVIASSGAANSLYNDAGRVYREALMFSVFGQTTAVMEASLKMV